MEEIWCLWCGHPFWDYLSNHRKYCSMACRAEAQTLPETRALYEQKRQAEMTPEERRALARVHYYAAIDRERAQAREYQRQRRLADPDLARERARRAYQRNPSGFIRRAFKRRSVLLDSVVEKIDRDAIYERDGGRCHICGKKVRRSTFELDHLIPLSKGGETSHRNLATSHRSCNRRRQDGRIPAQLRLVG